MYTSKKIAVKSQIEIANQFAFIAWAKWHAGETAAAEMYAARAVAIWPSVCRDDPFEGVA